MDRTRFRRIVLATLVAVSVAAGQLIYPALVSIAVADEHVAFPLSPFNEVESA